MKAKPSTKPANNPGAKGELLHPTHPVTVTLTADHDESDVIRGYPEFLDLLAHDDAFRDSILRDPDRVMETYGVKFDPPLSQSFKAGEFQLPPKNKVQALLDSLQEFAPSELIGHFNLMHNLWKVISTGGRK